MRISAFTVYSVMLLAAIGSTSRSVPANEPAERWITDGSGCRVYSTWSLPRESVTWSGYCVDGFASGEGTLAWFASGQPAGHYTGPMSHGRPDGTGTYTYANGDQFQGEFWQGQYDGPGTYTFANGVTYVGDFVRGESTRSGTLKLPDGRQFMTDLLEGRAEFASPKHYPPMDLFVICFTSGSAFESLAAVRLTQMSAFDYEAEFELRKRAVGAYWRDGKKFNWVVGEPRTGCHMVGYAFGAGLNGIYFNGRPE
jgi:hypothetical protein